MGRASLDTLATRFESKVDRSGDCHMWTRSLNTGGYGQINVEGKPLGAHVVAWFLATGEWPAQCVLHTCDIRSCVNVNHLFLGTRGDNNRDMASKGRHHNQRKTRCPREHEYTAENTYIEDGRRRCKRCLADQQRARNARV